ncbi:MAG: GNAT family N-acetyltransferase [Anaerolineae bacterium]|jgi:ribosomal protein S18 acetylase RimI-like enzyme|nr:GNAT family N-acetyltransferase [Anaerolineae bacterium]
MKPTIEHPSLTTLPGATLCNGSQDQSENILRMAEIFNATKDVSGANWVMTVEDLEVEYARRPNFDPCTQSWFVEKDERTIGTAECYWFDLPIEKRRVFRVMMYWRKEYFSTPLPDLLFELSENKCRELAANMETDLELVFSSWTMKKAEARHKVFKAHGYQDVRYFFNMTRDCSEKLDEYPLPAGVVIRGAEENEYRKVFDAFNEAFHDHWGYAEMNDEDFASWQQGRHFQPELWKIAWDGDQVCGTVLNYVDEAENEEYNRKRGYTETISVRRPWRGKGIAKAAIAESIRMFTAMGMEECALGVDAENPSGALRLYQSLGFKEAEDQTSIILGKTFD